MEDPVIAPSAYRHGLTDAQIIHAFNVPMFSHDVGNGMVMFVGGDPTGRLIEVGVVTTDDGGPVVVHAMNARAKYLR